MKYGEVSEQLRLKDMELRRMFAEMLLDEEFLDGVSEDSEQFHLALLLAQDRNWVHYTQLAGELGRSPAHVSKWFKDPDSETVKTPDHGNREFVLFKLAKLVQADVRLMEQGLEPKAQLKQHAASDKSNFDKKKSAVAA